MERNPIPAHFEYQEEHPKKDRLLRTAEKEKKKPTTIYSDDEHH